MKILIFSHKSDIDGMGGVILSKLAFNDVDFVLSETFNLQNLVNIYYNENKLYCYDYIFITDMWLEEPMLSIIANDKLLKGKFFIFDHHESALQENKRNYPFLTLQISNERGATCGTSLFYEFLIKNKFLDFKNNSIKEFVELTREYDTWEWITKYHNEFPHNLTLLFDVIGAENYINLMVKKLRKNIFRFTLNNTEKMLINNRLDKTKEKIKAYAKEIKYLNILNYKAGIIFIEYEYRNDVSEYLRQNNFDVDFVMFISMDYGTISYRSIKANVNVRIIAERFGGKGHENSASSPISTVIKEQIINLLINKN